MFDLIDTVIITIGAFIGCFIEHKLMVWKTIFSRLHITKMVYKWLLGVLVTGFVGGILNALIKRGIMQMGGSDFTAGLGGSILFGILLGLIIYRLVVWIK